MYWQSLWFRDPATDLPAAGLFFNARAQCCQSALELSTSATARKLK